MSLQKEFGDAAQAIYQADAIFVAAGAGMSVESGIPNYSGDDPEMFWSLYPALRRRGWLLKDCSHPALFEQNPNAAWGFYG